MLIFCRFCIIRRLFAVHNHNLRKQVTLLHRYVIYKPNRIKKWDELVLTSRVKMFVISQLMDVLCKCYGMSESLSDDRLLCLCGIVDNVQGLRSPGWELNRSNGYN